MRRIATLALAFVCRVAILAAAASVLVGCARPMAVVAPREALPADMTHCPGEPDGRGVRDEAGAAAYVLDLAAAGRACRHHLGATRATLDAER